MFTIMQPQRNPLKETAEFMLLMREDYKNYGYKANTETAFGAGER
jgi:hypothetical protein